MRRTVAESREDNLPDLAAALTYYSILSIFPALIALVSIAGIVGQSATKPLLTNVGAFTPSAARDILRSAVTGLTQGRSSAGLVFILGLIGAIWAASAYVAAFMRAANIVWDVEEGRPVWKTLGVRVGVTLVTVALLTAAAIAVVLTGGVARKAGTLLGIGETGVRIWDVANWPVLVLIAALVFGLLYYASPNVRHGTFRSILPAGSPPCCCGSRHRRSSRRTSQISGRTTRPTAASARSSCSSYGSGSRTSRSGRRRVERRARSRPGDCRGEAGRP